MEGLIKNIHVFILLYAGFQTYMMWQGHEDQMSSARAQIPNLNRQIKKIEKDKKRLQEYFDNIKEAKENIEKVAQEIEKLKLKLPPKISDTENLEMLSNLAKNLNIKDVYLSPQSEVNKGFYYSKKYQVKATGTFLQMLIFLEKVGESERLLNIHSLTMERTTARQKGRFQLVNAVVEVEAFRYNPDYKEDRGIKKIEEEFKDNSKKSTRKVKAKKGRS